MTINIREIHEINPTQDFTLVINVSDQLPNLVIRDNVVREFSNDYIVYDLSVEDVKHLNERFNLFLYGKKEGK